MIASLEQFVRTLASSGLLEATDSAQILTRLASPGVSEDPPDAIVQELVAQKKITRFQAEALREGKSDRLVLGNYLLLDELGTGGLGVVYKAIQRRMKQVVAIKVMSPTALESVTAVERFRREVEAAARLTHPNIIAALNADEAAGTHFLVTEFVDGVDLGRLVASRGPLPVPVAVQYIVQAARGLAFAHGAGVIHRDVKPSNLMLDRKGVVKVLDLGLARFDDANTGQGDDEAPLTQSGSILGTVDFMSAEQAENPRQADHRSDIYSLGCTLYYLLTGKPPYAGETFVETLLAHRESPIPSLRVARPEVSEALDAVFAKMVAKRADDRPQSMTAVIAALQPCLGPRDANSAASSPGVSLSEIEESTADRSSRASGSFPKPVPTSLAPTVTFVAATPAVGRLVRPKSEEAIRKRSSKAFAWICMVALLGVLTVGLWQYVARRGRVTSEPPISDQATSNPATLEVANDPPPDVDLPTARIVPESSLNVVSSPPPLFRGSPLGRSALVTRPASIAGIRSWSIETIGPRGQPISMSFSPDGSMLAGAGWDGVIRIWDAQTRELKRCLGHSLGVWSISWSPDGAYLASGGVDPSIIIWDVQSGRQRAVLSKQQTHVLTVAWSPRGDVVLSGGKSPDNAIHVWDVATGEQTNVLKGHSDSVLSLQWTSDGGMFASGSDDGTVRVWSWGEEKSFLTIPQRKDFWCQSAWSRNDAWLAVCAPDGSAQIWDVKKGEMLKALPPEHRRVLDFAWAGDGKSLALAADREGHQGVEDWNLETGTRTHDFEPSYKVVRVKLSPDDKYLVSSDFKGVLFWNRRLGGLEYSITGHFESNTVKVWSPDSRTLASGDDSFGLWGIWDAETGERIGVFPQGERVLALSQNGEFVLTSSKQGEFVRESRSGREIQGIGGGVRAARGATWSPDGKWLATGGRDKIVRRWAPTAGPGAAVVGEHDDAIEAIAWAPDSIRLASADLKTVNIWDTAKNTELKRIAVEGNVSSLAWTNDGGFLAAMCRTDGRVRVFRVSDASLVHQFEATWEQPFSMLAHGERGIAVHDHQGNWREWDGDATQPVLVRTVVGGGQVSPDGLWVADGVWNQIKIFSAVRNLPELTLVGLSGGRFLTLSARGHYRGSPDVESQVIYVVYHDDGQQRLYTPSEFAQAFGWKNDPESVRLRP